MSMSRSAQSHIISTETGVSQEEISSSRHARTVSPFSYPLIFIASYFLFSSPISVALSLNPFYYTSLSVKLFPSLIICYPTFPPHCISLPLSFFSSQPALSPKSLEALSRLCFGLSTPTPPLSLPTAPFSLSPSIPLPAEALHG